MKYNSDANKISKLNLVNYNKYTQFSRYCQAKKFDMKNLSNTGSLNIYYSDLL